MIGLPAFLGRSHGFRHGFDEVELDPYFNEESNRNDEEERQEDDEEEPAADGMWRASAVAEESDIPCDSA